MQISIVMCSLNEADSIDTALQSIRNQNYSGNYELILVDSGSTDNTVELASNYCDRIINAPKGKLTARNIGTQYAEGNIIVSVDADCEYSGNWLENLLMPFQKTGVIAVRGKTIHDDDTFAWNRLWTLIEDIHMTIIFRTRMPGRNSAYYKDMFYYVGGFDETVNQMNALEMIEEEEVSFGKRLSEIGKVVYQNNAVCYHKHLGIEKMACRALVKIPGYKGECDEYGTGKERF